MGLIAADEVLDFFIVRPPVRTDSNANGRPDVNHSQRHFNTGIVVIVQHDRTPSGDLLDRANGIRPQLIDWAITTGRRASIIVDPH